MIKDKQGYEDCSCNNDDNNDENKIDIKMKR